VLRAAEIAAPQCLTTIPFWGTNLCSHLHAPRRIQHPTNQPRACMMIAYEMTLHISVFFFYHLS